MRFTYELIDENGKRLDTHTRLRTSTFLDVIIAGGRIDISDNARIARVRDRGGAFVQLDYSIHTGDQLAEFMRAHPEEEMVWADTVAGAEFDFDKNNRLVHKQIMAPTGGDVAWLIRTLLVGNTYDSKEAHRVVRLIAAVTYASVSRI